ncbi:hypothetical protein SKDZ_02G2600 [Saccharomyces kudriavzevii ZP591]|nr:hypothetical protein SKDZ_02G2600 [Saccharomyces kudriavzevii ZP591]
MSFRHFKRRHYTSSQDESSSADEEHSAENTYVSKKLASVKGYNRVAKSLEDSPRNDTVKVSRESDESETGARSENTESSDDSSSSENEDMIPLRRPVFLKKKTNKQHQAVTIDQTHDDRCEKPAGQRKKEIVMKKIEKANQVAKNDETMKLRVDTNYSTNEELIRQCMLLNDDDEFDTEKERQRWIKRQVVRKQKHRSSQLAKQRELEEHEANRFAAMRKDKDRHTKYKITLNTEEKQLKTKNHRSVEKPKKSYDNSRYKVTRAKNIEFGNTGSHGKDHEENEYSFI